MSQRSGCLRSSSPKNFRKNSALGPGVSRELKSQDECFSFHISPVLSEILARSQDVERSRGEELPYAIPHVKGHDTSGIAAKGPVVFASPRALAEEGLIDQLERAKRNRRRTPHGNGAFRSRRRGVVAG
jgi:hypothetical protein